MLYVSLFLMFVAAFADDEITDCAADKPCDPAHKYFLQYTFGGVQVSVACKNEKDWYSKTAFSLPDAFLPPNLGEFCRSEGYDGVGKIMRAVPTNIKPNTLSDPADILCNGRSDIYMNEVDVERPDFADDHATWQCWNNEPQVECCTEWKAGCVNTRGNYNNFVACPHLGDECKFYCADNGPLAEGCKNCCRHYMKEKWRCSDPLSPEVACKRGSASKKDCKNAMPKEWGKCKYTKGKKGGDGRCKLKVYYGRCEDLKKRDCKKAVAKGRCVFVDAKEKACRSEDE